MQPTKTLGPVSARLLEAFQRKGKTIVTLEEALRVTGATYHATANVLTQMATRGVLARLTRATYLILQTGAEQVQLNNWPVIAPALIGPHRYFLSYYSAMRLHEMTSHPLRDVYLTVLQRQRTRTLGELTYHFIYSKREHFWGASSQWVSRQDAVQVSDLERTILDGLDRPELCGGLIEVVRGIWATQRALRPRTLARYVSRYRTRAAVKRLGWILETLQLAPDAIPSLLASIAAARDYVLLDPQGHPAGQCVSRWRLRLNVNLEELRGGVWG